MRHKNRHPFNKTLLFGALIIFMLLIAGFVFYRLHSHVTQTTDAGGRGTSMKGETKNNPTKIAPTSQGTNTPSGSQNQDNKSTMGSTNTAATITAPTGDFVSNHHPSLSNNTNTLQSVCNTTPGASCYISFSNGSAVKKLPGETTDRGGSAYWTWKLQDVGLTSGEWHIQAVASLNNQTKTTDDAMPLEVSQ